MGQRNSPTSTHVFNGHSLFLHFFGMFNLDGMMASCDNSGKKIGEINVIIRPGEGIITTNTVYSGLW